MIPTPSSESRLKRIDAFLSEVNQYVRENPNQNTLKNLFRKTIEMYYLTEDTSLKSKLPEKRIELLKGLHEVSLLAQRELAMSPKGDLAAYASACAIIQEIVLIKQKMSDIGFISNVDFLVSRLEKCCHKALEVCFYFDKYKTEKEDLPIPFELAFFYEN